jgi:hypothetical protein
VGSSARGRPGGWNALSGLAVLLAVLATGLTSCDSRVGGGAGIGHGASPASTDSSIGSNPVVCSAPILFQAQNGGVSDADLRVLATRLRATVTSTGSYIRGADSWMQSEARGGSQVSYRAAWTGSVWQLKTVAVCPAPPFTKSCGHRITYKRHLYLLEPPQPAGVVYGVARPLGVGWALGCATGPVGPIGVYRASEISPEHGITVAWNDVVHMFYVPRLIARARTR